MREKVFETQKLANNEDGATNFIVCSNRTKFAKLGE